MATEQEYDNDPSRSGVEIQLRPPELERFLAVVKLRGEHDMATAPDVARALGTIRGSTLVDLSGCEFVDSAIVGALIRASKRLAEDGHVLEILAPAENTPILRTLDVVGMHDLVVVHRSRPI